MPDVQTDTVIITIDIRLHGSITIDQSTLTYPSFAYVSEPFIVSFDILNGGGNDTYYSEVLDSGTELDRITGTIGSGATSNVSHTISVDHEGNVDLVINVGYVSS